MNLVSQFLLGHLFDSDLLPSSDSGPQADAAILATSQPLAGPLVGFRDDINRFQLFEVLQGKAIFLILILDTCSLKFP